MDINDEEMNRIIDEINAQGAERMAQERAEDVPRKRCPRCLEDLPPHIRTNRYCKECARSYARGYYAEVKAGARTPKSTNESYRGPCAGCLHVKQVKPTVHTVTKLHLGPLCRDCRVVLDRVNCDPVWVRRLLDLLTEED